MPDTSSSLTGLRYPNASERGATDGQFMSDKMQGKQNLTIMEKVLTTIAEVTIN